MIYRQQHRLPNQLKTTALLGTLAGLLLLIGYLVGGAGGLFIGLVFAIVTNVASYWFSDKISLMIYRAKPLSEKEHQKVYDMVHDLTRRMQLPMPKLYLIPLPIANAFATGRSPKHASIAVTEGILHLLSEEELKGVLAHELGHVLNRDILISSVAATIAAVISYVAFMARWAAIFGGFGGRDESGSNILELLALAIIAPLMATIIQLAISRSREYLADATAAQAMRSGTPLAHALLKIEVSVKNMSLRPTGATEATAHLFIANPFSVKGFIQIFSTHPSTEERVRRLRAMRC